MTLAMLLSVLAFGQTALILHDAGHRQIGSGIVMDTATDIVANLCLGLSWKWWRYKHGKHHANPNQEGVDPDIAIEFLAFSPNQCSGKRGVYRITATHQHILLIPLLFFEWWHLRVASLKYLATKMHHCPLQEYACIGFHICAYTAFWFLLFSPLQAICALFIHQALVSIYMGAIFIPNHFGMPIFGKDEEGWDMLKTQVLTSRDICGGMIVEFLFGGLNFQIEHHLFPFAPRNMLRRMQPIVETFCKEHGITYTNVSVWIAYKDVFRHLYQVSAPLRTRIRV
jgi:fatty acid desaturase